LSDDAVAAFGAQEAEERKIEDRKREKRERKQREREAEEEAAMEGVDPDMMAAMGFAGFGGAAKG